jgi:heat shock protein HtpX
MLNHFKTAILLGSLGGLLLVIGALLGGQQGMMIALIFAVITNFGAYWYSDKFVLKLYRARELSVSEYPRVHQLLNGLCKKNKMIKPELYLIPSKNPNAFATGRNEAHAVIGVTEGIIDLLTEKELKGVLAHELAHIKNKDMLIGSIAATIATTISFVAIMARWSAIFGSRNRNGNIFSLLIISIITPIVAAIIQMAISRSREFQADKIGAKFANDTKGLASALKKLEQSGKGFPMRFGSEASAHLFISNPFKSRNMLKLFSTHPTTEERLKRLAKIKL